MELSDHDKIQLVHDALAECSNSDQLYLLIHEHYTDATYSCSRELRTNCERLIGALVIQAITELEQRIAAKAERGDNDEHDDSDDRVTEILEGVK